MTDPAYARYLAAGWRQLSPDKWSYVGERGTSSVVRYDGDLWTWVAWLKLSDERKFSQSGLGEAEALEAASRAIGVEVEEGSNG